MKTIVLNSKFHIVLLAALVAFNAHAQDAAPDQAASDEAQAVDVKNVKKKYWAKGKETKLGVVQNRRYTKSGKFELGVFGGFVATDPFINVRALGGRVGYHFNEYFAASVFGWSDFVSDSSAREAFAEANTGSVSVNEPKSFIGAEATASLLYGKLSLVGKKIIYYDLYFAGGAGLRNTDTGNNVAAIAGLGQRFFLGTSTSLRLDYRAMVFNERVPDAVPTKSHIFYDRTNWSHNILVGFDILFK